MTITKSYPPHDMYHGSELPKRVESAEQRDDLLSQGWTLDYQHQPFPSHRYHADGSSIIVKDADASDAARKDGYKFTVPQPQKPKTDK